MIVNMPSDETLRAAAELELNMRVCEELNDVRLSDIKPSPCDYLVHSRVVV
jgi:hypothetical protein